MVKKNSLPGKYEGFGKIQYKKFIKTSRYVPGFDKTKLAVDVIRPAGEDGNGALGRFPAIMLISRGGRFTEPRRHNGVNIIEHCVPYGYVGIICEMRGCGASYGTNDSFSSIENRKDVNAVMEWVISQEWSDGQIATFGGSNRGLIQFAAAVTKPMPCRGLKGITPVVANADFYYQDYPNGVSALPGKKRNLSGSNGVTAKKTKEEVLKTVAPVDEDLDGAMAYEAYETGQYGKNHNFADWLLLENMCRDDENPNLGGERTNLTIPPVTDIDIFKKTQIKVHQFAGLLESGAFGQLMAAKEWGGSIVVGPWNHRQSRTGNPDLPEGEFDFLAEHHKWFDNLLKGVDNGFDKQPPFAYYMLHGEEGRRWRFSDTWPLENVKPVTFYLTDEKSGTCRSVNDGTLSLVKPERQEVTDYQVDTSIQAFDEGEGGTMDRMALIWDGDMTSGVDEKGLTFTSAPLFQRYRNEIAGSVSVDLWVTCTQNDADFILYLEEVLDNGESRYISIGTMRASHRTSEPRPAWNECGATYHPSMRRDMERCLKEGMKEPVHLEFAIEPAMYTFAPGSRLRITVTCANKGVFQHPMYDEDDLPVISLYQGGDHASFVRIPFMEHVENVYNGRVRRGDYQGPGTLYFFGSHVYLYYNGTWEKYDGNAEDIQYEIINGEAFFKAGFSFVMEGLPIEDGIIQNYEGGGKTVIPLPYRRRCVVDTVPVSVHESKLFVPMEKTLYVEEYVMDSRNEKNPAILYMHGYSSTPSKLDVQQKEFLKQGYSVIGIDMRNYPPNCFPDYVYDIKGCIRYVRAHAGFFRIHPEKIGCSGQSLGGNATLVAGVSSWNPELEGHVGGNEGVSSRLQAIDVGYGWSELLYLGADLLKEYKDASEGVKEMKFQNTDGPTAPAAEAIGFTGPGKGLKVLREYMESGKKGQDPYMDEMLDRALKASPVTYLRPDCPPAALYSGLGMVRVDIPDHQTYRTFELCNKYLVDCFQFNCTNGEYGKKYPVVQGIVGFFDQYLKGEPSYKKCVAVPGCGIVVENSCDRVKEYPPVVKAEGEVYAAVSYIQEFFGETVKGLSVRDVDGRAYVKGTQLKEAGVGFKYFEDCDMAVMVPAGVWAGNEAKRRN